MIKWDNRHLFWVSKTVTLETSEHASDTRLHDRLRLRNTTCYSRLKIIQAAVG